MLVLVLPFVVHWSYRCFFYSGGVHLLALLSPITGIVLDFVWYRNMQLEGRLAPGRARARGRLIDGQRMRWLAKVV